ncbi:hypothetical protein CTI14_68325, partial [Methylobacterium radiotolerans]
GLILDVTDLVQSERRARETDMILRGTLDSMEQGLPESGPDGALVALHGLILDVTDLVQSERRARETDMILRGTLDSMEQG